MPKTKQVFTNTHSFLVHWVILGLALLALGGSIGYSIIHDYNRIDTLEQERLMTQAKVVDINVEHDLVLTDTALVSIKNDLKYLKMQKNSNVLINRHLKSLSDSLPGVRTLMIVDADGKVLFSNREQLIGMNFSEREYFQIARQDVNPAMLYIPQPLKTVLGVFTINMARVLLDDRSRFAGIVSAAMDPEYCNVLLDSVLYSPGMRASLVHGDGNIFVEAPGRKDLAGMNLAKPGSRYTLHKESGREANIFRTGRAFSTGDERMSAWRTIKPASVLLDKPLMVTVNRDMQGIFASWRRDAFRQGGRFGVLILLAVFGLYLYQRRQRKYEHLEAGYAAELGESEERFRKLADATWEGIIIQRKGIILDANESAMKMFGYAANEIIGLRILDLFAPESMENALQKLQESNATPLIPQIYLEATGLKKDKSVFSIEMLGKPIKYSNLDARVIAIRDITDRKKAEQELGILSARNTAILAAIPDIVMEVDDCKRYTWANQAGLQFFGEDVVGQEASYYFEGEQETYHKVQPLFAGVEDVIFLESWQRRKDGEKRLLAWWCKVLKDKQGDVTGALSTARDVTEQKETEKVLQESEERFRVIFERSTIGKSLTSSDGKLLQMNKAFADMLGYTVEEMSQIHFTQITYPDDVEESRECIRILLANKQKVYRMEKRYIHKSGDIVWANVSTTLLRDEKGIPLYLITSIVNITDRKQTEKQLQDTLESLRKAVGTTIQVISSTVEARDPYTSGHQIRSADLARAIAMEMGLPQDKIDAIRMAGSIHDIGKISIPAEILSKPTKLSEIEFSLIKEHAQKGYEMLKDVESPWPLAEIVYQHHERMNGSGYPRNLKGEEILLEARILTVSDVVEAMASHRPYRAGLGINAALEEIEKNKGMFYDKTVADACLRLFREKGFKLEGT